MSQMIQTSIDYISMLTLGTGHFFTRGHFFTVTFLHKTKKCIINKKQNKNRKDQLKNNKNKKVTD